MDINNYVNSLHKSAAGNVIMYPETIRSVLTRANLDGVVRGFWSGVAVTAAMGVGVSLAWMSFQ